MLVGERALFFWKMLVDLGGCELPSSFVNFHCQTGEMANLLVKSRWLNNVRHKGKHRFASTHTLFRKAGAGTLDSWRFLHIGGTHHTCCESKPVPLVIALLKAQIICSNSQ